MTSKLVYGILAVLIVVLVGLIGYLNGIGVRTQTTTQSLTIATSSIFATNIPTSFEKLEVTSAYSNGPNQVVISAKNTGPSDTTITDILVNGRPLSVFAPSAIIDPSLPISLPTGASTTITITLSSPGLASGVTYDFMIHTASGNDYPKAVVIP